MRYLLFVLSTIVLMSASMLAQENQQAPGQPAASAVPQLTKIQQAAALSIQQRIRLLQQDMAEIGAGILAEHGLSSDEYYVEFTANPPALVKRTPSSQESAQPPPEDEQTE